VPSNKTEAEQWCAFKHERNLHIKDLLGDRGVPTAALLSLNSYKDRPYLAKIRYLSSVDCKALADSHVQAFFA
jgi:hypothetical protein